jgi:hypothetical protein
MEPNRLARAFTTVADIDCRQSTAWLTPLPVKWVPVLDFSGNPTNRALTASSLGLSQETAASALSGSSVDPLPLQLPLTIAMDLGPGT